MNPLCRTCPICAGDAPLFDVVDFNKSCEEVRGNFLPRVGIPIYYSLCEQCGFCFADEFCRWSKEDFTKNIYNQEYVQVDPDYISNRPRSNAESLIATFGERGPGVQHLDYGGGTGLLSALLSDSGWQSTSYDPFSDGNAQRDMLLRYEFITAYEVFEHVVDVRHLISDISSLLLDNGLVFFSTLLSDGYIRPNERLTWWYASPRNGHISLFSKKSLASLASIEGFHFGSFSPNFHVFWRNIPSWAANVVVAK